MNKPKLYQMCDGYCPESTLKGKKVRMRLNKWDLFESEETGLQVAFIKPMFAVILNFRGKGEFRTTPQYLDEVVDTERWSPQTLDSPPFGETIFKDEDEIKDYISKIPTDNINRKGIDYYAILANEILDDLNLPYLASKQSIQTMFSYKLTDYSTFKADRIIRGRLALIDGFYSTNLNKRLFGYDDIICGITEFANSDEEFTRKINEYLDTIKYFYDENSDVANEFNNMVMHNYGISKTGEQSGNARSLITKYCYFMTGFNFPIYDTLVNNYYSEIAGRFKINLSKGDNSFTTELNQYISKISILNSKIDDINKLDNLIWLYGKIKKGSYSLIMSKKQYLMLIEKIDFENKNSKEVDVKISNYVKSNIEKLIEEEVINDKQAEFIKFVEK